MPSITDGNYTLSFAREEDHEFAFLLNFPATRATLYPIRRYPAITEFRAMLTALALDGTSRCWSGGYFLGYVAEAEHKEPVFWFRAHDNGITFGFSVEEWDAMRALVRRAWDIPDIRAAWDRDAGNAYRGCHRGEQAMVRSNRRDVVESEAVSNA